MKFFLFCEHEGQHQFFNFNGTAEIGPIKFTLLQCMSCRDDIALPGELAMQVIHCEEMAQLTNKCSRSYYTWAGNQECLERLSKPFEFCRWFKEKQPPTKEKETKGD